MEPCSGLAVDSDDPRPSPLFPAPTHWETGGSRHSQLSRDERTSGWGRDNLQPTSSRRTLSPSTITGSMAVTWPTCGISCSRSSVLCNGRSASGGTPCLTGTTTARCGVWPRRQWGQARATLSGGGELTWDRAAVGGRGGCLTCL